MPQLLDKVISNVSPCAIYVSFDAEITPSVIAAWQPFYNTLFNDYSFKKAYASLSSIFFSEESNTGPAGTSYTQKITFRFPENDANRAERIALLQKIKYVILKFSNGKLLNIGRNDYKQNTSPDIKTVSNGRLCGVEITTQSIFPAGFAPGENDPFEVPVFIPLEIVP